MNDRELLELAALRKELQQHKDWLAQLERQTGVLIPRGQMLNKADYPALYASLDGYGETQESFKLPDLSGEYYMIPSVAVSKASLSQASPPDIEAAAKMLADRMDYPWEHMPEQGRASMREHAKAVISAAMTYQPLSGK